MSDEHKYFEMIDELKKQYDQNTQKLATALREKEELRIYHDLSSNRVKELETLIKRKNDKYRSLKNQAESATDELRRLQMEKEVMSHDMQSIQATCEKLTELLRDAEEKIAEMTRMNAVKDTKLISKKENIHMSDLESAKKILTAAIEKSNEEKKKLQKRITQAETSLEETKQQYLYFNSHWQNKLVNHQQ